MEVLGREIEVAGAKLLNHPRDLVDWCAPARRPPAPPVHNPLRAPLLIGVAQPAKMPLAHAQQLRRLYAAQLLRLMQPNRIDDPGHPDLRQHAIPPAKPDRSCAPKRSRTSFLLCREHVKMSGLRSTSNVRSGADAPVGGVGEQGSSTPSIGLLRSGLTQRFGPG